MLRLVAYPPNGTLKFPLGTGSLLLGSGDECDLRLEFDGVERVHAVLRRTNAALDITAAPKCVIQINGEPCLAGRLELLDELQLGDIVMVLEETDRQPLEGLQPEKLENSSESASFPKDSELGVALARQRLLEHLSSLSSWVLSDSGSHRSLESVLAHLIGDFGGGAAYLFEGMPDADPAVKLSVTQDRLWLERANDVLAACREQARTAPGRTLGHFETSFDGSDWLVCFRAASALDRDYFGAIIIPPLPFANWTPELGFATVIDLIVLGLVHHVGRYEPILPGRGEQRELTLAPGLVVGPSPRMGRLVESMQAVADSSNNVMILGESGTGRELVARSLHASGPGRHGPFVVLDCDEADVSQLAADMFGAQVKGKAGPVRREGKVQLAADGTLYLRSVDLLPIGIQGRLMRVLRSGSVNGPGPGEQREIEFRVMATSESGLTERMSGDRFRVDLTAALCQFVIQVPALRERPEDLPLLLQTLVNRFSHEIGKRVRGITTRTLQALAAYQFPGNLVELENTVRQMISLAGHEAPLDLDLLPFQIRSSRGFGVVDSVGSKEGGLKELVARVEMRAIVEALDKSRGNKSKAARLLGLSRGGLAQKMKRYQL